MHHGTSFLAYICFCLFIFLSRCGHCKSLAPTYESVATALIKKVNVAKIDCTVEDGMKINGSFAH